MAAFTKIKALRAEEKAIFDILKVFKEQLNKLKVEELELINRIREKNVTAATKSIQSQPQAFTTNPVHMSPEDINRMDLDLAVNKGFMPKNKAGTSKVMPSKMTVTSSEEESEMDSDDDYEHGENALSLFFD